MEQRDHKRTAAGSGAGLRRRFLVLRRIAVLSAAAVFSAALTACQYHQTSPGDARTGGAALLEQERREELRILNIGTADSGGTMYAAGAALSAAMTACDGGMRFNINASTGSAQNVEELMEGSVDMALVSGDVADAAYRGRDGFEGNGAEKLRVIAALYTSSSNWLVLKDSGLNYVHELLGKRAAIGPEHSATERAAKIALTAAGIDPGSPDYIHAGLGSGTELVSSGDCAAVHGYAGTPVPGLAKFAEQKECRLLAYTEEELDRILDMEPAYIRTVIPAGTYAGQTGAVASFGAKCCLCVSADMDEALAYHLTELVLKAAPDLSRSSGFLAELGDPAFLTDGISIPLHPGAERCYREKRP